MHGPLGDWEEPMYNSFNAKQDHSSALTQSLAFLPIAFITEPWIWIDIVWYERTIQLFVEFVLFLKDFWDEQI